MANEEGAREEMNMPSALIELALHRSLKAYGGKMNYSTQLLRNWMEFHRVAAGIPVTASS